jgi:hypothetical protein
MLASLKLKEKVGRAHLLRFHIINVSIAEGGLSLKHATRKQIALWRYTEEVVMAALREVTRVNGSRNVEDPTNVLAERLDGDRWFRIVKP